LESPGTGRDVLIGVSNSESVNQMIQRGSEISDAVGGHQRPPVKSLIPDIKNHGMTATIGVMLLFDGIGLNIDPSVEFGFESVKVVTCVPEF
jgi:hypothetical protein